MLLHMRCMCVYLLHVPCDIHVAYTGLTTPLTAGQMDLHSFSQSYSMSTTRGNAAGRIDDVTDDCDPKMRGWTNINSVINKANN
jgi:hypothetical protein